MKKKDIIKRYNETLELLKRWSDADIPDNIWSELGEDYLLPLDTQGFLKDVENNKKQG